MISSITGQGKRSIAGAALYCLVAALTGTVFGAGVAGVGSLIGLRDWQNWTGGALAGTLLVLGLSQTRALYIRLPSRNWQVPQSWVSSPSTAIRGIVWGLTLGSGFLTHQRFATFHAMAACIFLSGSPLYGGAVGALFGFTRSLPLLILCVSWRSSLNGGAQSRIFPTPPFVRIANVLALVASGFGLCLLVIADSGVGLVAVR